MANIVELIIRGDDQSARAIASSVKGLQGMDSALSAVSRRLAGLVSVGALVTLAKSAIDTGSALSDMSEKFGVSASDLSALSYPAKMVGVEIEGVGNAFKFMQKNIAEASNPISDQARALKLLGVSLSELKGKTSMEQFLRLSDAFNRLEDDENRAALAAAVFGRAWDSVIPLIKKGSAELTKMMEAAKAIGAAMSEEEIKKLDHYGDVIDLLGMRAKATAGRGLTELIDKIKAVWEATAKYGPGIEGVLSDMGVDEPGPNAQRFKAPPLPEPPLKVKAGSLEGTKAAEGVNKIEEEGQRRALKLLGDRAAALADFYGDSTELAKILAEEDIARGEKAIKIEKERIAYAEDLKGTMDAINVPDMEMDLADAMPSINAMEKFDGKKYAEEMFDIAMRTNDYSRAVEVLNEGLFEHFRIIGEGQEKVSALQNLYSTVFRGMDGLTADLANAAVDGFNRMTDALVDFAMTGQLKFREFANSVIADLMRIAVQQNIVGPLAQGLMGAFAGGGGMTDIGGSMPWLGPGHAAGGSVVPGMMYPVGERGVELFAPSVPGTIIPNGGGGQKQSVSVQIHNDSETPLKVTNSRATFDPQEMVVTLWIDAVNRNRFGVRNMLGGA